MIASFAEEIPRNSGKHETTSNPRFRKLLCLQERRVAEIFNSISQISSHRESIYFSAERQCREHEIKIQFPRRWTLNFYYKSIKTLLSASCEAFRRIKNCSKSNPSKWHDEWQFLLVLACREASVKSCLLVVLLLRKLYALKWHCVLLKLRSVLEFHFVL